MMRRYIIIILVILCGASFSLRGQEGVGSGLDKTTAEPGVTPGEMKDGTDSDYKTADEPKVKISESEAGKAVHQADRAVPTAEKAQAKDRDAKTAKKKEDKKTQAPAAKTREEVKAEVVKEEAKEEPSPFNGQGLLLVDEGDESLRRIPGIVLKKTPTRIDSLVQVPADVESEEQTGDSDGLLGMSSEKTETVAKVSIVVLIFFIFILYRMRSRTSGRRVVRTFPKK